MAVEFKTQVAVNGSGDSNIKIRSMPYMYRAYIKRSLDSASMGRLQVYIPEIGHPSREDTWISVRYLSPFAGASNPYLQKPMSTDFKDTQTAYGFWMVPPTIETEGLVGFINGDINEGVWLGCFFQENVNFTVPGIPSAMTYEGPAPGAEKNKYDKLPTLRPAHKPMKEALELQGLLSLAQYDAIRGTCTSGARRESPSRVFGILTPGQHQFVMDDGQPIGTTLPGQPSPPAIDQGIRIRTAGGAQLLLNYEKGIVYIINKQGTAWVELTNEGKMEVFCTDDISYHSLKDFNLHVDGDINIQSKGSIKIRAEGSDGININATTGDFQMKTAMNYVIQADLDGSLITAGQTTVKAARLDLNGGSATDAVPPEPAPLVGNVSVLQSVCTRVPEHEPWLGHEDKKLMPLGEGLAPGFTSGGGPS